jgi:hypothetical protein
MLETNRGISLIIMILGVIVLTIIGLFVYWEFFSSTREEENINFAEEGNLLINNPGFMENVWYLSYESAGSSAKSAKLSFDEDSICNGEMNCSNLVSGERVKIKGIENSGEVLVRKLD